MTIEHLPQITEDIALLMLEFIPNSVYCPTDGLLYVEDDFGSIGYDICRVAPPRKKKFKLKD